MADASKSVLSVSDLAHEVQQILAMELGTLQVRGEVSRFTAARSGHWYLTLKDDEAVIDCAMFRGQNRYVRVRPSVGDLVVVSGQLDLYAPRGQLSFIVRRLKMSGEGDLQQRIEALKRKLAAEGLMEPSRKRLLPALPKAIGVATSPTGAAFQDILRVTGERFPSVPILLAPCRVQGREAPREICAALRSIVADGRADVIIVGRGGGSAEDLMAFNDEQVARTIAGMPCPVVSAVGHETDVSIADLVADVRAATPSHAAELVVPDREGILLAVDDLGSRLRSSVKRRLDRSRERLVMLRLPQPQLAVERSRRALAMASDRLVDAMDAQLIERRTSLEGLGGRLHALSPQKVLERGYAMVRSADGRVLSTVADAKLGEQVQVEVVDGIWDARIEAVHPASRR
jgi:exodeoxyribonuclease VII large subunit